MKTANVLKYIETHQSLTLQQQAIIKVLAVYYGYSSMTNLGSCLSSLGVQDGTKAFNPKLLSVHLRPLIASGLLEESRQSAGVRCIRPIAEYIVRMLVDEGQFERYAAIIEQHNPTHKNFRSYLPKEHYLRVARIAFYHDDWNEVSENFNAGLHFVPDFPFMGDVLLSWFFSPLDIEWTSRHQPKIIGRLLEFGVLHKLLYLYAESDLDAAINRQAMVGNNDAGGFLFKVTMALRLLRGEWDVLEKQLFDQEDPELQAIAGAVAFLAGDHGRALGLFDQALSRLRKQTRQRSSYFNGLAGIFYPLAIWKSQDHKKRDKLTTLLSQAMKHNTYWIEVYRLLEKFFLFLQGNLPMRDTLLAAEFPYEISDGLTPDG